MRRLLLILLALVLLTGCATDPKPEYCYRWGSAGPVEAWFCEGRAQFPADTLPDDLKDQFPPPVVPS